MIFSRLSVCRHMCFCMKKFIFQEVFKIKQLNLELMFQLVIPTNFKNHYLKTIDTKFTKNNCLMKLLHEK